MVKNNVKLYFEQRLRWRFAQQLLLETGFIISAWEFGTEGCSEHGHWIEVHGVQDCVSDTVPEQPTQAMIVRYYDQIDRMVSEVVNG